MIDLNEFLAFIRNDYGIYIRIRGEKISTGLDQFIKDHPTDWELFDVDYIRPSYNDLIIVVHKYF